ncbi:MAG: hypothetical protein KDF57_17805, partial [Ottowia sp.]|nr:hypothetical protein [Ottowia sp.]
MSLRTTPLCVSTFTVLPEIWLVPSAGYGPLVSSGMVLQVPELLVVVLELLLVPVLPVVVVVVELLEELLELELLVPELLLELLVVVSPPPPQAARITGAPADSAPADSQRSAWRRAAAARVMVPRSWASWGPWSSSWSGALSAGLVCMHPSGLVRAGPAARVGAVPASPSAAEGQGQRGEPEAFWWPYPG